MTILLPTGWRERLEPRGEWRTHAGQHTIVDHDGRLKGRGGGRDARSAYRAFGLVARALDLQTAFRPFCLAR